MEYIGMNYHNKLFSSRGGWKLSSIQNMSSFITNLQLPRISMVFVGRRWERGTKKVLTLCWLFGYPLMKEEVDRDRRSETIRHFWTFVQSIIQCDTLEHLLLDSPFLKLLDLLQYSTLSMSTLLYIICNCILVLDWDL